MPRRRWPQVAPGAAGGGARVTQGRCRGDRAELSPGGGTLGTGDDSGLEGRRRWARGGAGAGTQERRSEGAGCRGTGARWEVAPAACRSTMARCTGGVVAAGVGNGSEGSQGETARSQEADGREALGQLHGEPRRGGSGGAGQSWAGGREEAP